MLPNSLARIREPELLLYLICLFICVFIDFFSFEYTSFLGLPPHLNKHFQRRLNTIRKQRKQSHFLNAVLIEARLLFKALNDTENETLAFRRVIADYSSISMVVLNNERTEFDFLLRLTQTSGGTVIFTENICFC